MFKINKSYVAMAVTLMFFLALTNFAQATIINPISYSMLNGQSGSYSYWDENYNGFGNKTLGLAPLWGGLGDLSDGIIATQNWNIVEAPPGNGPYVGWNNYNPLITFFFSTMVTINQLTIYVDDANGYGGVMVPAGANISMGGANLNFSITDPFTSHPIAVTFSGLNLTGNSLGLTLNRRASWIMLSEVAFEGSVIPEPSTFLMLGAGLLGLIGYAYKRKKS
ncbi:PEP-CTERM sorting domain-containing protein [candidate division KSB1 bacterium]|nr:PEP-CTERM sorting domain-containing protein [candidate division KSB1 bacterium]